MLFSHLSSAINPARLCDDDPSETQSRSYSSDEREFSRWKCVVKLDSDYWDIIELQFQISARRFTRVVEEDMRVELRNFNFQSFVLRTRGTWVRPHIRSLNHQHSKSFILYILWRLTVSPDNFFFRRLICFTIIFLSTSNISLQIIFVHEQENLKAKYKRRSSQLSDLNTE